MSRLGLYRKYAATGLSLGLGVLLTQPAAAMQSTDPDDVLTVHDRAVMDDLPVGVRAGDFLLSPGMAIQTTYDDNILRTPTHQLSDVITDFKPAFAAQSDWDRNSLFVGGEGDLGYFKTNTDQNYQDYGLLASGQYDFTDDTYFVGSLSRAKRHEDFGSISDPNGEMPLAYTATREQGQFTRELGLIQINATGQNEHVAFSNIGPEGNQIEDDLLSRNNRDAGMTLTYAYMDGNDLFVSGNYDTTDYKLPGSAFNTLNANGTDWRAGIDFDDAHSIKASAYGGYIFRKYEEGTPSTSAPFFGGNINWTATTQLTLSAILDKTFNETTVADEAGALHTTRKLMAHEEISPSWSVDLSGGIDSDDFVGGGPLLDRDTRLYYGELAGHYKLSENLGLRGEYDIQRRTSPLETDRYLDNRVFLSLVFME